MQRLIAFMLQQRQKLALTLKGRGNKAYSAKRFTEAIEFYSKAIECEEQAVFYSNRAACACLSTPDSDWELIHATQATRT